MKVIGRRSPAEHREIIASIFDTIPANDSDIKPMLNWPTISRLKKSGRADAVAALIGYRNATAAIVGTPCNDNSRTSAAQLESGWRGTTWHDDAASDATEIMSVERNVDIRPTVNELLRAAARISVTTDSRITPRAPAATAAVHRSPHGYRHRPVLAGPHLLLGDLIFRAADGADIPSILLRWKLPTGKMLEPREMMRGAKGPARKGRPVAAVRAYLALGGVETGPAVLMPDGGAVRERPAAKLALEQQLRELGVDASVDFNQARKNAGLAPAAIDPKAALPRRGIAFMGGISKPSATHQSDGASDVNDFRDKLSDSLGPRHAAVLDLAMTDARAEEVGNVLGFTGKYAERRGVVAIDAALDALMAIAA